MFCHLSNYLSIGQDFKTVSNKMHGYILYKALSLDN